MSPRESLHDAKDLDVKIEDLVVAFGAFHAVDHVDLDVAEGHVHFLIGPNGAGKTTLIDSITGLVPYTGKITVGGHDLAGMRVQDIARLGIGRSFQTATVFERQTVLQNLDIAYRGGRSWTSLFTLRRGIPERIHEILQVIGLTDHMSELAGALSHGQKQWLEIGMVMAQDARVVLLDEPVAGMTLEERDQTGELLKTICPGRVVMIVEHDMEFMRKYADAVTVMARGSVLVEGSVEQIQADKRVQDVYLGAAEAV
ncbi:urea ABC transporter ATP-binding protein UrtD [Propionibacterium sp.]|uniref:urea ABC transporter ATP-binding protein UrtD n=1 Tax=Propionibacterium sp. TaxID=1977903 RepID=UPI0039E93192